MSLSDELRSALTKFREHVADMVNSGMLVTIDGHLDRLAAAAQAGIQVADDTAKGLLLEAYTALHGAPPVEATPEPAPAAPVEQAPAAEPVIVGEPGPELALPDAATVVANPDPAPAVEDTVPAEVPQTPEALA